MRISDWSSDVCSSDLSTSGAPGLGLPGRRGRGPAYRRDRKASDRRLPKGRRDARNPGRRRSRRGSSPRRARRGEGETKGRSEEHTSELQSLMRTSYAVFCLKKTNAKLNAILTSINTNYYEIIFDIYHQHI